MLTSQQRSWKGFLSALRRGHISGHGRRRPVGRPSDIASVVERLEERALLTDLTPPVVLSATPIDNAGGATFSQVKVVFDEAVATSSATDVQNYRLTRPNGTVVTVTSATMDPADVTGKTVLLTVVPQSASGSYGVHAGGVSDLAGNAGAAIGRSYVSTSTLTFNPIAMETGDYDGDGLLDITIASNNGYDIWFYKGLGNGDFGTASLAYSSTTAVTRLEPKSADIDGDGKLDLVMFESWSDSSSGTTKYLSGIGIYFGNGDGTFQTAPRQTFAPDGVDVEVTDIDDDGDLDILTSASYSFRTYLNPHNPLSPAPASQATVRSFDTWNCVVSAYAGFTQVTDLQIGDVNGDGRSDVVASYSSYPLQIWLGTATPGVFAAPVVSVTVATGVDNALADLNGDGRLDFISSYAGTIAYGIAGSPYFSNPQATALGSDAYRAFLSPVDLDGDGDLDLVAGRTTPSRVFDSQLYVLYNQGGGVFESTVTKFDPDSASLNRIYATEFADLNGDGLQDVIGLDSSTQRFFIMKSQIGAASANFAFSPNNAPTLNAGGAYSIAEGDSLSLSAAGSTDPDGDALTYSWDINNDGVFGDATGVAPSLTWSQLVALGIADNGSRTVAVRATDSRGGSATSTAALTVTNTAPTLVLSGSGTVNEGASYTLNLSSSDPGSDTITSWTIHWGDGTITSETTHTYGDDGVYEITATATDEDGTHPAGDSWSVVVANVAPTINVASTGTSLEGSAFTQTGTINDVGAGDTWTATVDYGDGTGVQTLAVNGNSFSLNHVYADNGTYTVTIIVKDDDDGSSPTNVVVTVQDVAPVINSLAGLPSGNALQNVTFTADVTKASNDNVTYAWSVYRNGASSAVAVFTGGTLLFSPTAGNYRITLIVTDDDGTPASAETTYIAKGLTDARADLIAFSSGTWNIGTSTFANNANSFVLSQLTGWGTPAGAMYATGDVNGDGVSDVLSLDASGLLRVGLLSGGAFASASWGAGAWTRFTVGDANGDGRDDVMAYLNGAWHVALSTGTGFDAKSVWTTWSTNANWQDVKLADLDKDGRADLIARNGVVWYFAESDGTVFSSSATQWSGFANGLNWDAFFVADLNQDGYAELLGKSGGDWRVGIGSSSGLSGLTPWASWSSTVAWNDAAVGDFNGDGKQDIIARANNSGNWWVALSSSSEANVASLWTSWNSNITWQDIRVGDFDGDKRDDLAGRNAANGNWFVSLSNGSSMTNGPAWATGWTASYGFIGVSKVWRDPDPAPAPAALASTRAKTAMGHVAAAKPSSIAASKEESLALFWSSTNDDERFAAALLSASRA